MRRLLGAGSSKKHTHASGACERQKVSRLAVGAYRADELTLCCACGSLRRRRALDIQSNAWGHERQVASTHLPDGAEAATAPAPQGAMEEPQLVLAAASAS